MWETVAQAIINGLLIGGIYALVSIGVTLIFGVVKIVNFAQGEFVMIGMYISFFLANQFGIDPLLSLFVSMPVLFVAGVLIQHFLIRRVLALGDMPQIFLTFAMSLLLINVALLVFTANYRTVETPYSEMAIHLGPIYIAVAKLIAFALAMALSAALWAFLHTTDLGKAMRAAAQNPESARLCGIPVGRMLAIGWGLAAAIGAVAGIMVAPVLFLDPNMMGGVLIYGFAAAVLGGLTSPFGAVIGGFLVGIFENLVGTYIPGVGNELKLPIALALIVTVLVVKPAGLFGRPIVKRV